MLDYSEAITFPDYSDLAKVSGQTRLFWEHEMSVRERYRRYFDGNVFQDRVPSEEPSDAPLMYPVGLNLVKMMTVAAADDLFGEWEDEIVRFSPKDDVVDDPSTQAAGILSKILTSSKAPTMLWEIMLDANVYGGGVMKVSADLQKPGHVLWTRIPLQSFFPVWNPDDLDDLLEVFVVVNMTMEQARGAYGLASDKMIIQRIEHWTKTTYETWLDGKRIDAYSGTNPWGFIPYLYIPRLRTSTFWGDAMTEDIISQQDELNMRIADLGESISYNAHPTRWGYNLPKDFNQDNYPLDPNAFWNMGRSMGTTPPPFVALLEVKDPAPQGSFDYMKFIYDWARIASNAPPIVFGEDNGGGQRSGDTLEIRMGRMVKAMKRQRSYLGQALMRAAWMTGKILEQKRLDDIPARAIVRMMDGSLLPRFADILPRDHQGIVDEVVKLLSTEPKSISLETAIKILGRGKGEEDRIRAMLKEKALFPSIVQAEKEQQFKADQAKQAADAKQQAALAGKETPQTGGSN